MKLKNIVLMFLSLVLVILFQNCGEVSLQAPVEPVITAKSTASGKICPIAGAEIGVETRVLFVADMSLSNLGLGRSNQVESGKFRHSIDFSEETDRAGRRFQVMRDLITNISQENPNTLYSVMGFHDEALLDERYESCSSGLINATQATSAVNGLASIQNITDTEGRNGIETWNSNTPFKMKNTSYLSAIKCLKQKIEYDLASGNREKNLYHIVFLTDGKPTDAIDPCMSEVEGAPRDQCYMQYPEFRNCGSQSSPTYEACVQQAYAEAWYKRLLESMDYQFQGKIGGIKFIPVFYGKEEDQEDAAEILTPLAHVFDDSIETKAATDFAEIFEYIEDILAVSSKVVYQVRNLMLLNLTALPKKDVLEIDSNMNGIPDNVDDNTLTIRDIVNSYVDDFNIDKDLVPSFIEKIRGLSVTSNDTNLNYDGDNYLNYEELQVGRDVNSSDFRNPMAAANLQIVSVKEDTDPCSVGSVTSDLGISFNVKQMTLIPNVAAYTDIDPSEDFNFSHEADENLILLTYVAEPINSMQDKKYVFGYILKAKFSEDNHFHIDVGQFKLLGELQ